MVMFPVCRTAIITFALKRLKQYVKGPVYFNNYYRDVVINLKYSFQVGYPTGIKRTYSSSKRTSVYFSYAGMFSIFGLFGKKEHLKTVEEEITDIIKMAILEQKKDHHKVAEQLLHLALKTSQEHDNSAAVIYIYDLLANNALTQKEFEKAEKLFRKTMQMLYEDGMPEDHNAILEISIKLADIYWALGKDNEALTGYLFAYTHLDKKVNLVKTEDDDTILLWGMCADSYGRFLMSMGKYKKAYELFKKAYDSCHQILGTSNPQTVVLINNIGNASGMVGDYDESIFYLKQAISIARENNFEDLPAYYCNLGMIYLQMGMLKEAELYCKKASTSSKVETTFHNEAVSCLKQVHSLKLT